MAIATHSNVFDLRPECLHLSADALNVGVGVKPGATPLILIPSFRAVCCAARRRPVIPCLDATYDPTPVDPKYPDVDVTRTTDPLRPLAGVSGLYCM